MTTNDVQIRPSQLQDDAIAAVLDWVTLGGRQTFRLFGYAGTGKTTIAKMIAEAVEMKSGLPVVFAAYTGKAASVLRSKGCRTATTIHQLIYKPKRKVCTICEINGVETEAVWKAGKCAKCGSADPNQGIDVSFGLRGGALSRDRVAMVVIDECSMVGENLGGDLLSFGVPILVLGDPAQLPPVGDGGFFTSGTPEVLLTEIHRQKDGCGILDMATAVRKGERLVYGEHSESRVLPYSAVGSIDPFEFDQVLVGKNDSRRWWNKRIRSMRGVSDPLPVQGDKLICCRNNHELRLMNGEMVLVESVTNVTPWSFRLDFRRDGGTELETCDVDRHHFDGKDGSPPWGGQALAVMDFGWAITTHKSQGSQWPNVLVVNEARVFRDDAARWLYTAITRASKSVTVIGA